MAKKHELGQGLQNLLSDVIGIAPENEQTFIEIKKVYPNKSQPRAYFAPVEMEKMVESIKANGILQPIIVRPVENRYEIVAGERRWRAAKELGLRDVPVIIKDITQEKAMEIALVENLQRSDLNPIEKALAYNSLIKNYNLTQEEVAKRLSVDRSSVSNIIRLLELPDDIQDYVSRGTVSMGHARALLGIKNRETLKKICKKIINEGLSVRQVEKVATELKNIEPGLINKCKEQKKDPIILEVEDKLRKSLKTKVSLKEKQGRGKLILEFYNNKQLEQILKMLGVSFAQ